MTDDMDDKLGAMYGFESICEGFYHLAGGLLKLHNGPLKNSTLLHDESERALRVHEKICGDFLK